MDQINGDTGLYFHLLGLFPLVGKRKFTYSIFEARGRTGFIPLLLVLISSQSGLSVHVFTSLDAVFPLFSCRLSKQGPYPSILFNILVPRQSLALIVSQYTLAQCGKRNKSSPKCPNSDPYNL